MVAPLPDIDALKQRVRTARAKEQRIGALMLSTPKDKARARAEVEEAEAALANAERESDGSNLVDLSMACDAVRRFFEYHVEGLRLQHPGMVDAGVSAKAVENRYFKLMRWLEARAGGKSRSLYDVLSTREAPSAESVRREIREAAARCHESWHAAVMIGFIEGRYGRRDQGIDDYTILTGHWWEVDWGAVIADIGPAPPGEVGRPPADSTERNNLICAAVGALVGCGFPARRRRAFQHDVKRIRESKHPSACAIVAGMMLECEIVPQLGERRIEALWTKLYGDDVDPDREEGPWLLFSELDGVCEDDALGDLRPVSEWGREVAAERIAQAKAVRAENRKALRQHLLDLLGDDGPKYESDEGDTTID